MMLIVRPIRRILLACAFALPLGVAGGAGATSIGFSGFTFDAGAPVTVAADGSTATLAESPSFAVVFLSNLPALGDPVVIVAAPSTKLIFDYAFDEPGGNDDSFQVALLDGTTGDSLGAGFEFSTSSSSSGSVEFDLSSLVGTTLGLQFELAAELGDAEFTSSVVLSNLRSEVPEPGTLVLILTGLGCLTVRRA